MPSYICISGLFILYLMLYEICLGLLLGDIASRMKSKRDSNGILIAERLKYYVFSAVSY